VAPNRSRIPRMPPLVGMKVKDEVEVGKTAASSACRTLD
jgi:hypothetical protein